MNKTEELNEALKALQEAVSKQLGGNWTIVHVNDGSHTNLEDTEEKDEELLFELIEETEGFATVEEMTAIKNHCVSSFKEAKIKELEERISEWGFDCKMGDGSIKKLILVEKVQNIFKDK